MKKKILEIGYFFRCIIKNIISFYEKEKKEDWKIDLEFIGKTWVSSLTFLYEFLWKINNFPINGKFLIRILYKKNEYKYLIYLNNIEIKKFLKLETDEIKEKEFAFIDLDYLENIINNNYLLFWIALLKGEGITFKKYKFIWKDIIEKIKVSSTGWNLIFKCIFPLGGLGLIIKYQDTLLPFLFYYNFEKFQIKLERIYKINNSKENKIQLLKEFTKNFRYNHSLPLTLTFSYNILDKIFNKKLNNVIEFFLLYEKEWIISLPLEIDDFISNKNILLEIFSLKRNKELKYYKEKLIEIFKFYLENGIKYIKFNKVYINLKDINDSIILEINQYGVFEIDKNQKVNSEDIFMLDIEIISTLISWLNDTSLRLMTRFIDEILPAEISEKIKIEETLIILKLKDLNSKDILELSISSGEHEFPQKEWKGDFWFILMDFNTKEILFKEDLINTHVIVTQNKDNIFVEFPSNSSLKNNLLKFNLINSHELKRGGLKIISDTSVLSEITPGLRTYIYLGENINPSININNKIYKILEGKLFFLETQGRILKYKALIRYINYLWITFSHLGYSFNGIPNSEKIPKWWNKYINYTENCGGMITKSTKIDFNYNNCIYPKYLDKLRLIIFDKNNKSIGFTKDNKKIYLTIYLLDSYAIPFDKKGNFIIRSKALVKINKEIGFGLIEIPCKLSLVEDIFIIPLKIKKEKKFIKFIWNEHTIFSIKISRYIKLLKPGYKWSILRFFNLIKKDNIFENSKDEV